MQSLSLSCQLKIADDVSDFVSEFTAKISLFGQIQGMLSIASGYASIICGGTTYLMKSVNVAISQLLILCQHPSVIMALTIRCSNGPF